MSSEINSKKAVSLMLSYVILISIIIGVSIAVYTYLHSFTNDIAPSVDCNEGTSLILIDYFCTSGGPEFTLENNGRFNIDGIVISVGNNTSKAPTTYLIPQPSGGILEGYYQFTNPLKPQQTETASFTNKEYSGSSEQDVNFKNIRIIQIQPYILDGSKRILCEDAVIKQEITNCQIKD